MIFASWIPRLKTFVGECRRVLRVTKKPDRIEFKTIVKVSGLGMIIIGLIGFTLSMAKSIIFP